MKQRIILIMFALILIAKSAVGAEHPLVKYLPSSPLLFISGEEIGETFRKLENLKAVKAHNASGDRQAFDKSKLALKLKSRIKAFGTFVGHDIDMKTFLELSGRHTVFALYDIGNLRFLMVSDLGVKGQGALSYLEKIQGFDERKIGDKVFYVKEDPDKGLAFALFKSENLIIISNDIILAEQTILNMENANDAAGFGQNEHWRLAESLNDAALESPMILYADMERLLDDGYFRYYWVFRNREKIKEFKAVIIGIDVSQNSITERRFVIEKGKDSGLTLRLKEFFGAWQSLPGSGKDLCVELSDFFGWNIQSGGNWGGSVSGRLFAINAQKDKNDLVYFAKGVALLVDGNLTAGQISDAILAGIKEKLLIVPADLAFTKEKNGFLVLEGSGIGNCYISRTDDMIFISDDLEIMRTLIGEVEKNDAGIEEDIHVDLGKELPVWTKAFSQMGPSATFPRYDTGFFFYFEMTGLLNSMANFNKFTLTGVRKQEDVLIQTVVYGR